MAQARSVAIRPAARAGFDVVRTASDTLGIALIGVYVWAFVFRNVSIQGDFRTYLLAAQAAQAGLDPYQPADLARLAGRVTVPYVYPPITLLAFVPMAKLSFAAAAALWMGLKLALLAGLVVMWRRWLGARADLLPLALIAVFGWNGSALWDLRAGNVALLEAALLWSGLSAFAEGRRTAFAALIVAAACFKLWPAAFLLLLLVPAGKDGPSRSVLLWAGGVLGALVWLPCAVGPGAGWEGFLRHLPAAEGLGESNPSALGLATLLAQGSGLSGAAARWTAGGTWGLYVAGLVAVSIPFLRTAWRARDPRRWAMGAVFLYVLLEPRPMAYGFALLAPAPLFFSPRPFEGSVGRLLLALVLSAQGLGRATNYQSASALYVYAPLLLTLCIWLLVVNAVRESQCPSATLAPKIQCEGATSCGPLVYSYTRACQ